MERVRASWPQVDLTMTWMNENLHWHRMERVLEEFWKRYPPVSKRSHIYWPNLIDSFTDSNMIHHWAQIQFTVAANRHISLRSVDLGLGTFKVLMLIGIEFTAAGSRTSKKQLCGLSSTPLYTECHRGAASILHHNFSVSCRSDLNRQ